MNTFLLTLLKGLLVLLLLALLAGGCYFLTIWRGWPLWVGGAVFAGVLAVVALVFFIRRFYFRRREKQFVRRVIDQDDAAIQAAPSADQDRLRELQRRWAKAVDTLRSSKLKLRGDPLYVLPWYMILGETGSGKTTAVKRAGLTAVLTDLAPGSPPSPDRPGALGSTRNVDWWFFEEAVILDTAGRYAIPIDEGPDKAEWESFLTLLTRYRRKEPLDGLVVTVAADRLLTEDAESLTGYGLSIRRRINQLMRSMGARFPVYVLVTKMDQVLGLGSLMDFLSDQDARQSMGYAVEQHPSSDPPDPDETAWTAVEHVADRLRELRLPLMLRSPDPKPGAVSFPAELSAMAPSLAAFMRGCFGENPYTETPFLRGVFFSSGRQAGQARSRLLHKTDLFKDSKGVALPETERGLFLTDLFASILPRDRGVFTPLNEFIQWRAVTRHLALIAWLLFTFCVAGVLSYSYVNTRESLELVAEPFPSPPELTGDVAHDLYVLSLFANAITLMDKHAADNWVGHLGLTQAGQAGRELRTAFLRQFQNGFLHPLDKDLNAIFSQMGAERRNQHISDYISYAVWRVNMIEHTLGSGGADIVSDPPDQALALAMGGRMPEIAPLFREVYEHYLAWSDSPQTLRAEAKELRMWLGRLLAEEGVELHWMVQWAATRPGVEPVTLGEFWSGPNVAAAGNDEAKVHGAYTPDGYDAIDEFLAELRSAAPAQDDFIAREKQFRKWYAAKYYQAWEKFALQFAQGEQRLLTPEDWQAQASQMVTIDNPYFTLLERMHAAFKPVSSILGPPALGRLAAEFSKLRAAVVSQSKTATLAEEVEEKASTDVTRAVGKFDPKAMQALEAKLSAVKALQAYLEALEKFLPATATMESGYKYAQVLYSGAGDGSSGGSGGAAGPGPLENAEGALRGLQGRMDSHKSAPGSDANVFWDVMRGPIVYMLTYVSNEASCQIQMLWEGDVLSRADNTPKDKLRSQLFGKNGLVEKFAQGPAKPFLQRTRNGWTGKQIMGVSFPFTMGFLNFLDESAKDVDEVQDQYTITVRGLPTNVNHNATMDPIETELRLDCEDGVQVMENFNFPAQKDFVWKPGKCDDTVLLIHFPNLKIAKTWQGRDGFQQFLRDFSDGAETYAPKDFPSNKGLLDTWDVENITVSYTLAGAGPVLDLLDQKPPVAPENIAWCWYRDY